MDVAVINVGDEILVGDTINTNAAWLGQQLAERGVSVERITVVPDRVTDIVAVLQNYRDAYDSVIVTGGLGPTHDDITMDAVASALDRPLEEHSEALEWLTEEGGYSHNELARGTTHLPRGARALHNEVGVAPGAVVENVYVLPGVPAEMKAMFETIAAEFEGVPRYTAEVKTPEPESALIDRLIHAEGRFDVRIGSYPGDGVRIKITGTDIDEVKAATCWLRENVDMEG